MPKTQWMSLNTARTQSGKHHHFETQDIAKKIRRVAHDQTMEGLVLLGKKAKPASSDYKAMYLHVFKAVVVKRAALNKSDSQLSTPSISNIGDYMEQGQNQAQPEPKMEVEELSVPL
jgi:hypothetical protein